MAYKPPSGMTDCEFDAAEVPFDGPFKPLEIRGVDTLMCRKPMGNAVGNLGKAVDAKISEDDRNSYIGLFVQNHLHPDSWDQLIEGMMLGKYQANAVQEVCQAITTWGTARPTRR